MAVCRKFLLAMILLLALSTNGCNNPKGALKLRLESTASVLIPGRPMFVEAIFSADHGTIAIDRPSSFLFDAEITHLETGQTHRAQHDFVCGTAMVANPLFHLGILFFPVIWLGAGMDVADVGGRYAVITPDREHKTTIALLAYSGDGFFLRDPRSEERQDAGIVPEIPVADPYERGLATGRYLLRLTYECDEDPCPPRPLFWRVYDQQVTAEIEFTVAAPVNP